ncbi:MAG TPA: ABC transporter ATP-binding protein [Bacteroidales bacterium]|nr:ABC transporter ATP-binding protein [Bacteroidales bacterium]
MKDFVYIAKTFRLLKEHQPGKLVLIFALTLFMGVNSGFSIMLLIPLLQLLNVGSDVTGSGPGYVFHAIAEKTGISFGIETILIVYVILITINALLQYWKTMLDTRYQQTLIYYIRRRLFMKIIHAEWPMLNSKSKTNHLQVLTKEVPNMAEYVYYYLRLITTIIISVSYIAYALAVSAGFTLLIIAVGGILFFVLRRYLFRSFHLGEEFVSSYNRLLKYIDDFWQTVKIAKVHSSEDFYFERFDEASNSLLNLESTIQRNWSLPQLIYRVAGIVVLVIIVYLGYHSGRVPVTSFFILIVLFSRIFPQFVAMNTDLNMILTHVASVKLVMKLDEEFTNEKRSDTQSGVAVELEKEIKLDNISFSYDDGENLFDHFSQTIPARSITGIIGESGIGKTTLIDLIAGLQRPTDGKIFIDDRVLDDDILPHWKAGIGYLPQDSFFIDGTLRENLIWDSPVDISDKDIMDVLEQVNALHLPERFENGLDAYIVNYSFCFSGGECQRLALARVLLRRPRLLLLDEATSSLDSENEAQIMDVICRLKEKVTIIFVTHRMSLLGLFDNVIKL